MKIPKRQILFKGLTFRLLAVTTFSIGTLAAWYAQKGIDSLPSRIVVTPQKEFITRTFEPKAIDNEDLPKISNADFQNARLLNFRFSSILITSSDFSSTDLRKADLRRAEVICSSFAGTDFRNVVFTNAKIFCSDLTNANLRNATLTSANFAVSDFSNAHLEGADLTDSNLSDARLQTAHGLTYAQLSKAVINDFTELPPNLESRKTDLVVKSKKRFKYLRKTMLPSDFERYSNTFDFLD